MRNEAAAALIRFANSRGETGLRSVFFCNNGSEANENALKAEVAMAMAACNVTADLAFVPQSGPFVRGIFATLQFATGGELTAAALRERARHAFADSPFIRIVEPSPRVAAVAGSNFADLAIAADDRSAAIMIALDNLGKGMASQAVQSMNIALGLSETAGWWQAGRYPA